MNRLRVTTHLRRRWIFSCAVGIAVVASAIVATAGHGEKPLPPGLSAGVSALDRPTPDTVVPAGAPIAPDLAIFAKAHAQALGLTVGEIMKSARLLRRGLGRSQQGLYAFKAGALYCFVMSGSGGGCQGNDGASSFAYTIGGGDANHPGALVGLVADDVSAISLTVDGQPIPVSVVNSVAYAQLPAGASQATVVVTHSNGVDTSDEYNLKG